MSQWPDTTAVLIPAYKAADHLKDLLPRLLESVPADHICVVDDASEDDTGTLCARFGITCLHHAVNQGKGAALLTGFSRLSSETVKWIITMDADGQHSPDDLPAFITAANATPAPGICIGARSMKLGTMPPERILSNRLTSGILSLFCGVKIIDSQCGYRMYSVAFLEKTSITFQRFEMESEIIMKAAFLGFPVTFVPIQTLYLKGPSHISHLTDTLRWILAVINIRFRRKNLIASR